MHSKQKGALAESAVTTDLYKKGMFVAHSNEDLLPFDLIAINQNHQLYKVQVKYSTPKRGVLTLDFRTSMSNKNLRYSKNYTQDEVDVFAVYNPENDMVLYIPSHCLERCGRSMTIRVEPSKNNQKSNTNWFEDYLQFPI